MVSPLKAWVKDVKIYRLDHLQILVTHHLLTHEINREHVQTFMNILGHTYNA